MSMAKHMTMLFLMRDFNTTEQNEALMEFLEDHDLLNLVKIPTCVKNADNPSTLDLIIIKTYEIPTYGWYIQRIFRFP